MRITFSIRDPAFSLNSRLFSIHALMIRAQIAAWICCRYSYWRPITEGGNCQCHHSKSPLILASPLWRTSAAAYPISRRWEYLADQPARFRDPANHFRDNHPFDVLPGPGRNCRWVSAAILRQVGAQTGSVADRLSMLTKVVSHGALFYTLPLHRRIPCQALFVLVESLGGFAGAIIVNRRKLTVWPWTNLAMAVPAFYSKSRNRPINYLDPPHTLEVTHYTQVNAPRRFLAADTYTPSLVFLFVRSLLCQWLWQTTAATKVSSDWPPRDLPA